MTPMQHRHRLPGFYATMALVLILWGGCACTRNNKGDSTPATRAASMRKELGETAEGKEIHEKLVAYMVKFKLLQAPEDQHATPGDGDAELYEKAEGNVRKDEEALIHNIAMEGCYVNLDYSLYHNQIMKLEATRLAQKEEKNRKITELKIEMVRLLLRLGEILVAANNSRS